MRPRSPRHLAPTSRVAVSESSRRPCAHQTAQLTQIRKVVGRSSAVEQPRPAGDASELDVLDHRSHRRDAGAAGDEQEPALVRP